MTKIELASKMRLAAIELSDIALEVVKQQTENPNKRNKRIAIKVGNILSSLATTASMLKTWGDEPHDTTTRKD